MQIFGGGGYFYAFFNDSGIIQQGSHPYLHGGINLSLRTGEELGLGLGGRYRNYLGLYQEIGLTLSTSYYPGKKKNET